MELGKPQGPNKVDRYEYLEANLIAADKIILDQRAQIEDLESQIIDNKAEIFNLQVDRDNANSEIDLVRGELLRVRANWMVKLFSL